MGSGRTAPVDPRRMVGWRQWQFAAGPMWSTPWSTGLGSHFSRERTGKDCDSRDARPVGGEPEQFVTAAGLDPAKANFTLSPYYALDDPIVESVQRDPWLLHPA